MMGLIVKSLQSLQRWREGMIQKSCWVLKETKRKKKASKD
jgi:hypothetical protein